MRKLVLGCLFMSCANLFAITFEPTEIIHKNSLNINQLSKEPMVQFQNWYQEMMKKSSNREASSFVLATVNENCSPISRFMMAKNIDNTGITFVGDLNSMKFEQLKANASCAATFFWLSDQRQVNFTGKAQPLTQAEARAIWNKRSKMSQISSLASMQGQQIDSLDQLIEKKKQLEAQYQNTAIPMPKNWGGYRLIPNTVEFWQAGPYNTHSRVLYTKNNNGVWEKIMLAP